MAEDNMDDAEIVAQAGEWWVIESASGRRYHLRTDQIRCKSPHAGERGRIGYVQGPSSLVQVFICQH